MPSSAISSLNFNQTLPSNLHLPNHRFLDPPSSTHQLDVSYRISLLTPTHILPLVFRAISAAPGLTDFSQVSASAQAATEMANIAPPLAREEQLQLHWLQLLKEDQCVETLERGVAPTLELLERLWACLGKSGDVAEFASLKQSIYDLRHAVRPTRTIIGVVGSTGAGKSSIINSVFDEESLLPTSGMRACTAVITELSYNHSDDPSSQYRAEVHFIEKEEWQAELAILFSDLGDHASQSELLGKDTDAGIAYSKLR